MVCEPRFDVYTLHYLCPEGSFETQVVSKLSSKTTDATKQYYSKTPYSLTGYTVGYSYGIQIENVYSATSRDKITVNTDWLTENQINMLKDVISSPVVYLDAGDARGALNVKVTNNSFAVKKKFNEKLFSASFDLEYSHFNVRQKG